MGESITSKMGEHKSIKELNEDNYSSWSIKMEGVLFNEKFRKTNLGRHGAFAFVRLNLHKCVLNSRGMLKITDFKLKRQF